MIYRAYLTDAAKFLTENTSRFAGGHYLPKRYLDITTPQKEETRTGEDIKAHMKRVLGGLEVNGT